MSSVALDALHTILHELWPYGVAEEIQRFGSVVTEEERLACVRAFHGRKGVRIYRKALRGLQLSRHPNALSALTCWIPQKTV